jgi:undecaprenyl diphosphate synthase
MTVGEGYAAGAERIRNFREWAFVDNDIDVVSVFLLSTENIERRPEEELAQLYTVFENFFEGVPDNDIVNEHQIKHEVRGNGESFEMLPDRVIDAIDEMEEHTSDFKGPRMVFLIPYGGRDEIIRAAKKTDMPVSDVDRGEIEISGEDEETFRENLLVGDLPDVDLMVRTSEQRISNFLLYHNAYAEMVFLDKMWPSFTETDFYESIYKFSTRERRYGV